MFGKGPHEPEIAYDINRIHSLMIYGVLEGYNIVAGTQAPLVTTLSLSLKAKGKRLYNIWTVHELADIQ